MTTYRCKVYQPSSEHDLIDYEIEAASTDQAIELACKLASEQHGGYPEDWEVTVFDMQGNHVADNWLS